MQHIPRPDGQDYYVCVENGPRTTGTSPDLLWEAARKWFVDFAAMQVQVFTQGEVLSPPRFESR